jgi:hypothetical protein
MKLFHTLGLPVASFILWELQFRSLCQPDGYP